MGDEPAMEGEGELVKCVLRRGISPGGQHLVANWQVVVHRFFCRIVVSEGNWQAHFDQSRSLNALRWGDKVHCTEFIINSPPAPVGEFALPVVKFGLCHFLRLLATGTLVVHFAFGVGLGGRCDVLAHCKSGYQYSGHCPILHWRSPNPPVASPESILQDASGATGRQLYCAVSTVGPITKGDESENHRHDDGKNGHGAQSAIGSPYVVHPPHQRNNKSIAQHAYTADEREQKRAAGGESFRRNAVHGGPTVADTRGETGGGDED